MKNLLPPKPKIKFDNFNEYYRYFSWLIDQERKETILQIRYEILNLDPEEREKRGRAILNLKVKDIKPTLGGRWQITFYKDKLPETEINVGDLVILSQDPSQKYYEAVVSHKTLNTLTVVVDHFLPADFLNSYLRVDLFCNDISFKRMHRALEILSFKKDLFKLLAGKIKPQFKNEKITIDNSYLNHSQKQVVKKTLLAKNFFLIQGPPGTGKTTTLAASCYEHVKRGFKILATADSNVAVDNLVEALSIYPLKIVRLGHPAKVLPHLLEKTLDFILETKPKYQDLKFIWQEIERLKNNLKKVEVKFQSLLPQHFKKIKYLQKDFYLHLKEKQATKKEIRKLKRLARKIEKKVINEVLSEADVICTTNSLAGSDILENFKFDVVFIDEANQSTEPSTLVSLIKGKKFIMAGDHQQLPPTVVNEKIAPYLGLSLFERLIYLYGQEILGFLSIQYRMPQEILEFSNRQFYDNKIISQPNVASRRLSELLKKDANLKVESEVIKKIINPYEPLCFVHVESQEKQFLEGKSYFNEKEAWLVKIIYEELIKLGLQEKDIGIISPYADQVKYLKNMISGQVEIKTIDGFQGREKEVIILTLVRANSDRQIGFLKEKRRLNVALTRAKRKLIVIGNEKTIIHHKLYQDLIDYFKHKGSFITYSLTI